MADPSEHTITADLPYPSGGTFKADLTYVYTPPCTGDKPDNDYPAELELIKAVPLDSKIHSFLSHQEVTAIADTWLQDDGYEMACQLAEHQRGGK